MTKAQELILKYLQQRAAGQAAAELVGVAAVRAGGKLYGVNIFCDILEIMPSGKNRIIARSNVSHSILTPIEDPTAWEDQS